jgi:hypothetical protein
MVMEWISVEDRLPVMGSKGQRTTSHDGRISEDSITHWMPLPEPPHVEK